MNPTVRPITTADRDAWLTMRCDLWPGSAESHATDIDSFFAGQALEPAAVLIAEHDGRPIGFAELSLRPYGEGCRSSPVGYLEGWYVSAAARGQGVGTALIGGFEAWARAQGCQEIASDTEVTNGASAAAHRALGFEEVETIRCFRKALPARRD